MSLNKLPLAKSSRIGSSYWTVLYSGGKSRDSRMALTWVLTNGYLSGKALVWGREWGFQWWLCCWLLGQLLYFLYFRRVLVLYVWKARWGVGGSYFGGLVPLYVWCCEDLSVGGSQLPSQRVVPIFTCQILFCFCVSRRSVGGSNPRLRAVKGVRHLQDLVWYQRYKGWLGYRKGIGTVSFVLSLISFVTEFLWLVPSTSFYADLLIGVAVMGHITVGQLMGNVYLGILGGLKTVLGFIAEVCILPCFGVCNRLR